MAAFDGAESQSMRFVGNSDKDGTVDSDLAFWGDLAVAGNYDGFRILDIGNPRRPRVLSDSFCRGPQNDVSVYKLRGRLLLFQSVDTPQTQPQCDGTAAGSSRDTALSGGQRAFGFEGIRVFDVTNPTRPQYLTAVPTACGSHTHTLIPDQRRQRVLLYVSSYPLGSGITPAGGEAPAGLRCQSPHQKISIVEVTSRDPDEARLLREEPLSDDTAPYPGAGGPLAPPFNACHDIQAFLKKDVAVAACAGDGQIGTSPTRRTRRRRAVSGTRTSTTRARAPATASSSSTAASSPGTGSTSRSWTRPAEAARRSATARRPRARRPGRAPTASTASTEW